MRRAFASSLCSLLLLSTLVWGGCVSCEQYFMWTGAKGCCAPGGRCKTKQAPSRQTSDRACKQIAFDHQKSIDLHFDQPVLAAVAVDLPYLPLRTVRMFARSRGANPFEPSPPDLQVLNSTFLI